MMKLTLFEVPEIDELTAMMNLYNHVDEHVVNNVLYGKLTAIFEVTLSLAIYVSVCVFYASQKTRNNFYQTQVSDLLKVQFKVAVRMTNTIIKGKLLLTGVLMSILPTQQTQLSSPACPVSYLKDDAIESRVFTYRYPDLYFVNQTLNDENSYNCSYINVFPNYKAPKLRCFKDYACPIHPSNILTAVNKQTWIVTTTTMERIVAVMDYIKQNTSSGVIVEAQPLMTMTINIFFIGGSMTNGEDMKCGCICIPDYDSRCKEVPKDVCGHKVEEPCKWQILFVDWLQKQYRSIASYIRFNRVNLAKPGADSYFQASCISNVIHERGIQLTEYDLFFIDESVNDGKSKSIISIQVGLEALIRRIQYIMSQALNQTHIRPTIILIEQLPFAGGKSLMGHDYSGLDSIPSSKYKDRDYAVVYEGLAEHYSLLLWSVRDVYWTHYNMSIDEAFRYPIDVLGDNPMHRHAHIPWFANTYMADLLAGCFLYWMKQTVDIQRRPPQSLNHHHHLHSLTTVVNSSYPHMLFSSDAISKSYCDESKPFLLYNTSLTSFNPKNLTEYDNIHDVGWREYIDYHNVSGYMINKYSHPHLRSLVFNFSFNLPSVDKDIMHNIYKFDLWMSSHMLKIVFLKSYENMGVVTVSICGSQVLRLDGLHSDYKHNRISIPEFKFYDRFQAVCNQQTMNISQVVVIYEESMDLPNIRKLAKFKLMSVEICSRGNDAT